MERQSSNTVPETQNSYEDSESDADLMAELGFDLDTRADALKELESIYGDRIFRYEPYPGVVYSGTVAQMNACPAFNDELENGASAAAGWLEANDNPNAGEEVDQDEEVTDELKADSETEEVEVPIIAEAIKDEPKPTKVEKVIKKKKVEEISVPTPLPDAPAELTETAAQTEQQSAVNGTYEDKAVEQVQPMKQQAEKSAVITKDISEKTTEQPAEKIIEKVSPETTIVVEKSVDATSLPSINKKEQKIAEDAAEFVEQKVQVEAVARPTIIEQIDDEETEPEIFHIPHVETEEIDVTPIEAVINDEILFEAEEDTILEYEVETDLVTNDMAIDQIDNFEEAAVIELSAELFQESEHEQEPEVSLLESVLEREQSDEEQESEVEQVRTVQHDAISVASVELVGEAPDVDVAEYNLIEIQNRVAAVAEHIEVLEHSKNEQECRDAIIGLRKELANLLASLGYQDIDKYVEQIIRNNHDMSELKRIIESLLRAAIVDESITDNVKTANHPRQKFGQWVVQRTTTVLQAA